MVDDLLALSRIDAGDLTLVKLPVPLEALTQGVVHRYSALARSLNVDLRYEQEVAPGTAQVIGDPDRIEQILSNLIKNALEVSYEGRVTVAVKRLEDVVQVSVADSGPGIAPEDIPRIWDRFFKADRSRKRGGTGLGLAIARRLVELHGASIDLESEPGRGSVFYVRFPAADKTMTKRSSFCRNVH